MTDAATLRLDEVSFHERPVTLRLPFRFGVVTLTEAPQAFLRARITLADGRSGWGMAAEMLAPKWFDKDLSLTNEQNFDQLRRSLAIAAGLYEAAGAPLTPYGLHAACYAEQIARCGAVALNPLVAGFGTALLDRAIIDALGRLEGASAVDLVRANRLGVTAATAPDLEGFDLDGFLAGLSLPPSIHARHTVGLVDPITAADLPSGKRVNDGLPETLDECVGRYGLTHFKLKVGGDREADVARLAAIAGVLDRSPHPYFASLDGNEQYGDADAVVALWRAMREERRLERLCASILFIEQPIARSHALSRDVSDLAEFRPVEIDESDATMDAFVEAKRLGYTGVSSKSCKGFYHSLLNRARCAQWNGTADGGRYFMSAEDLTTQAGVAVQQDLVLAGLIGCNHVERNGHHYVNGMAAAPQAEQDAFLAAHPDLYHREDGVVRVAIRDGHVALGSLACPGLGFAAEPDLSAMISCRYEA